jgi:hypothetical protein
MKRVQERKADAPNYVKFKVNATKSQLKWIIQKKNSFEFIRLGKLAL